MTSSTSLTKDDLRLFSKQLTRILILADRNAIELYQLGKIGRSEKLTLDKQRDALEEALREIQRELGNMLFNELLDTNKSSPAQIIQSETQEVEAAIAAIANFQDFLTEVQKAIDMAVKVVDVLVAGGVLSLPLL
jgi:wyosine [tRNA(Phe)-imidazoG37] synthetase (radical SAM superfamily)